VILAAGKETSYARVPQRNYGSALFDPVSDDSVGEDKHVPELRLRKSSKRRRKKQTTY